MAGSHLKHNNILADIVAGYIKYKTELKEYMLPTRHKHPGVGNERYTAKRWVMSDILIVYILYFFDFPCNKAILTHINVIT